MIKARWQKSAQCCQRLKNTKVNIIGDQKFLENPSFFKNRLNIIKNERINIFQTLFQIVNGKWLTKMEIINILQDEEKKIPSRKAKKNLFQIFCVLTVFFLFPLLCTGWEKNRPQFMWRDIRIRNTFFLKLN